MPDLLKLVRENRWTSFMFFCLLALYSFLFVAGLFSHKHHELPPEQKESVLTVQELRQKEETAGQNLLARPGLAAGLSILFLGVLGVGVGLDIYLLSRGLWTRRWAVPPSQRPAVRWGPKELAQGLIFMFFIEGAIFIVQSLWDRMTGLQKMPHDIYLLGNSLLRDLCVVAFVWGLVRRHGHSLADLGLHGKRFLTNIRIGVLGYWAMVPPMLVGFFILAALMNLFSYEPLPQNVVQMYLKEGAAPYLFFFTLFVAVFGPVLEEIFFRGFAYPALKRRIGRVSAMTLTAAVFAAFHMSAAAFLPIFFLGFFLTYLYESTGSLVPSIAAHVLHNAVMVTLTLGFRSLSGGT